MAADGPLKILAAGTAAAGVFAIVTGAGWAAVLGGVLAVATASVALRSGARVDAPRPEAIDLADEPTPVVEGPDEEAALAPAPSSESPQLLGEEFLDASLRSRLAVARRALRPLSVVHVMVLSGDAAHPGPVAAELIAAAAEATLRESDIVGRRDDGVYVFVLEDTAEDGAVWTTERLRRHISGTIGARRFQAGVASYPNHGLDADTVDANAAAALKAAQDWDRDRIEVAAGR